NHPFEVDHCFSSVNDCHGLDAYCPRLCRRALEYLDYQASTRIVTRCTSTRKHRPGLEGEQRPRCETECRVHAQTEFATRRRPRGGCPDLVAAERPGGVATRVLFRRTRRRLTPRRT